MKPEETVKGEGPGDFYSDSQEQTHHVGRGRRKNKKRGGKRKGRRSGRR